MKPTVGRIVFYGLTSSDAEKINRRRVLNVTRKDEWVKGAQAHVGVDVHAGDVLPAIVTAIHNELVSAQVFLDGNDTYWIALVQENDKPDGHRNGMWMWPPRD